MVGDLLCRKGEQVTFIKPSYRYPVSDGLRASPWWISRRKMKIRRGEVSLLRLACDC